MKKLISGALCAVSLLFVAGRTSAATTVVAGTVTKTLVSTNILQPGTTLYVASATIQGQLTVGTVNVSSVTSATETVTNLYATNIRAANITSTNTLIGTNGINIQDNFGGERFSVRSSSISLNLPTGIGMTPSGGGFTVVSSITVSNASNVQTFMTGSSSTSINTPTIVKQGGLVVSSSFTVNETTGQNYFIVGASSADTNVPTAIKGSLTPTNANTGDYGEFLSSTTTGASNCAATTTFGNVAQINLTPGVWDIFGQMQFNLNGAVASAGFIVAVSSFSGNTVTDHVDGVTTFGAISPTITNNTSANLYVPGLIAATTTMYLKGRCGFSSGTPQTVGSIYCIRRN